MNKRISILFLTLGLAALLMPACQNKSDKPTSQPNSSDVESESEEEHKHKYSSDWTYDHDYHWHAAICGHDVIKDKAEHKFNEEEITEGGDTYSKFTCSICGYSYKDNEMYKVTWYRSEPKEIENIIYSRNYPKGETPSYDIDKYGTPTKEHEDIAYRYEFSHWSPAISPVESKQDYVAQYDVVENKYHVTWKNYDNSTLYEQDLQAGQTPVYPYTDPTRPDDGYEAYYSFEGWSPEPGPLTQDTVYTAQFSRHVITDSFTFGEIEGGDAYEITGWAETPSGSITIPGTYHGKPVKGIADEAFKDCTLITSVITPASLEYIGDYAFEGCTGLVTFGGEKLANITSFGKGVFKNCSSFVYYDESRDIANKIYGLSVIPEEMFYGCTSLGSLTGELFIHGSIIGKRAFYNCTSMVYTSMNTSDIERIEEEAFYGCTGLETVGIPDINCNYVGPRAFYGCTGLERLTFNNNSVTICESAFENCTKLATLSGYYSHSIQSIGNKAFKNTKLSTVNLYTSGTNSLTAVGDYAFENCTSLTTFRLPKSVLTIGYGALKNTPQLTTLDIPFVGHSTTDTSNQYLGYIFGVQPQSHVAWDGIDSAALEEINLYHSNLTTIPTNAFYDIGNANTNIIFPSSMTTIKQFAFSYFRGETLNLADGITMTNWQTIEGYAFDANYIKNISVPFIGERPCTMDDMDKSTYYTALRFVDRFANRVYMDLTKVTCYEKYYPTYGFSDCSIRTLVIGSETFPQYISDRAFSGITNLTRLEFTGTTTQFNNISKSSTWKAGLPSAVNKVYCSNGTVSI